MSDPTPSACHLATLFPAGVVTAEADPRAATGTLLPAEAASLGRATDRRRREFTAGRQCAHAALARLGIEGGEGFALLPGADRAPRWPPGVTGTITHTRGYCGVAVVRCGAIVGLGLDAEPDQALPAELRGAVLTPAEQAWLAAQPAAAQGGLARLVFSIKESVYKAQHAVRHGWLGFHDVEVEVEIQSDQARRRFSGAHGRFAARLLPPAGAAPLRHGAALSGRFRCRGGLMLTGLALWRAALVTPDAAAGGP